MDRNNRFIRALAPTLIAALLAGCSALLAVRALGFASGALVPYAAAFAAAYAINAARGNRLFSAAALGGTLLAAGLIFGRNFSAAREAFRALSAPEGAAALAGASQAGSGMMIALSLLLGMLFGVLVRSDAGKPFIILIFLASAICSLALNESLPVWLAFPGLVAALAAFAVPAASRGALLRPVVILPAVVLAAVALALVPAQRTTWAPLENLAVRVRAIVEDYMNFTQQRIVFSINEQGYDRAGVANDELVAMLGGPANPKKDAVMQVETQQDMLLRGTIKRTYTGYSWIDDQVKARYLYYDFTHRSVRSSVFDQNRAASEAFPTVSAKVEMLAEGTSTLFVPAHMAAFSMNFENAVYYNSTGEVFLTRDVAPGDVYEVSARVPAGREELLRAAAEAEREEDGCYDDIQDSYTALPAGVNSGVYALAVELTKDSRSAAEKALAIEEYLAQNYRYTLEGGVPAAGQDFVSYFLLESKEGYCSYFASAMTVLCRIAGLPARYVEGYAVKAEADGTTIVTGEDAHAWVEVYLKGLGWTAFDPTATAAQRQDGQSADDDSGDLGEAQDTPFGDERVLDEPIDPAAEPTPTVSPLHPEGDADENSLPTPEPEGDMSGQDQPTPTPEAQLPDIPQNQDPSGMDAPEPPQGRKGRAWLWILLAVMAVLLLAALAVYWVRRRLEKTDPLKLSARTKNAQAASLILYRGILTLLLQMGLAPASGETPQAFAARVVQAVPNPDYAAFVSQVVNARYSGRPVDRSCVEAGRSAYASFLSGMRRREKIRFIRQRLLHGLGSFELIP